MLHEQFQKERTAAEGTQGTLGVDGVDEPLDAGKVGGVEQERRFPAQLCGSVQQGKGVGLLQVLADAGRQSRRQLELVVEGNIPVLFPRGAGRQGAALGFQQAQQCVCLRRAELFYLEKFDSLDQLEKAIVEYIDYYNNRRIKLKLNGLSPVQYRIQTVGAA